MDVSRGRATSAMIVTLAVAAQATSAWAQVTPPPVAPEVYDRGNNQSIRQRAQPEFEPQGVRLGGFRLYPRLGVAFEWNDNVFASETTEIDDTAFVYSGGARLQSDWGRHALAFEAQAAHTAYSDLSADDGTNWSVLAEGRLDIRRSTALSGSVSYTDAQEERGFVDLITLIEPIDYTDLSAAARLTHLFNRLRATAFAEYHRLDYDDGLLLDGPDLGADPDPFDQDFRDANITELGGRLDYYVSPSTAVWTSVSQRWNDYRDESLGIRDFDRTRALIGAAFDITNVIRGEFGVGYSWARFDNPLVSNFNGWSARAAIDWFVTQLTNVTFVAERDVDGSGEIAAASVQRTNLSVRVDHELYRNVVLWARAGWADDEFQGIDRTDTRITYGAGADWLVNRWASINVRLVHTDLDSSGAAAFRDFEQNRALIGVTFRR